MSVRKMKYFIDSEDSLTTRDDTEIGVACLQLCEISDGRVAPISRSEKGNQLHEN